MQHQARRSKLIIPQGPGGLIDLPGNISVVVSGPRQWDQAGLYPADNRIDRITDDQRLARFLGVDHFRMPPAAPSNFAGNDNQHSPYIPVFRFPRWHYCKDCGRMERLNLNAPFERSCTANECPGPGGLIPFRWVAICDHGHMEDAPLMWWVHRNAENKNCTGALTYRSGGAGDTMASIRITCTCGASENLDGITGRDMKCHGRKPWLGNADEGEECDRALRVVLKGASNVYFPKAPSGLFIPVQQQDNVRLIDHFWSNNQEKILEKAARDETRMLLDSWLDGKWEDDHQFRAAEILLPDLLSAIHRKLDGGQEGLPEDNTTPSAKEHFRFQEFKVFKAATQAHPDLSMRKAGPHKWAENGLPNTLVSQVVLFDKLRETRVLTGFQRREPDVVTDPAQLRALLWGPNPGNWLPAIIVRGEGIFIRFDDELLADWETKPEVKAHFDRYVARINAQPGQQPPPQTPRFLFLHTLAHLLIRRLTFECGYGSSSLRERIYCHEVNNAEPMNAIVIYTASGDAEGSLGGLVRQGEPGRLESMLRQAVEDGEWCSSDPVCSDIGLQGQGPGSVNGAACHNCALVPETSCEFFNNYLDRKFVVDLEGVIPSLFQRH